MIVLAEEAREGKIRNELGRKSEYDNLAEHRIPFIPRLEPHYYPIFYCGDLHAAIARRGGWRGPTVLVLPGWSPRRAFSPPFRRLQLGATCARIERGNKIDIESISWFFFCFLKINVLFAEETHSRRNWKIEECLTSNFN